MEFVLSETGEKNEKKILNIPSSNQPACILYRDFLRCRSDVWRWLSLLLLRYDFLGAFLQ